MKKNTHANLPPDSHVLFFTATAVCVRRLYGVDDLRVEPHPTQVEKPLGPNDVRVRVGAVGICGSDVHYLKHMRCADFVVEKPMVIGHEAAGVVAEVGSAVRELACGDHVALEPGVPCRTCGHCKTGRYNLCEGMEFHATPPVHGSLARFVTHPSDFCFKLPPGMTLEEGAMCEPVSVGVHACRRAGVEPGQKVAVLGAGPIGLVSMMVAKAFGAAAVVITDVSDERLKVAKDLGADVVVNVKGLSPADAAAGVVGEGGRRPDACVDCCGFESSVATALAAAKSGGKVCLVGMGHNMMNLPVTGSAAREVDLVGVFRYRDAYPTAIHLVGSGAIDVQPLITHRFSLAEDFSSEAINEGFRVSAGGGDAIKVMFDLIKGADKPPSSEGMDGGERDIKWDFHIEHLPIFAECVLRRYSSIYACGSWTRGHVYLYAANRIYHRMLRSHLRGGGGRPKICATSTSPCFLPVGVLASVIVCGQQLGSTRLWENT
ncbi:unnamed protein product [Pylaiella littoralis]